MHNDEKKSNYFVIKIYRKKMEITINFLIPHINKESEKIGEKKAIVICRNHGECEKFRFVKPQFPRIIFVQNVHFNFGKMMLLWSQVTEACNAPLERFLIPRRIAGPPGYTAENSQWLFAQWLKRIP